MIQIQQQICIRSVTPVSDVVHAAL
jgi:hypothetical protein